MDDFLRDQNRTRRQDHKYHCLVRNPICFEDVLRRMLADSRRARLLGRRAPLRKRNAAAKELAGRSTAAHLAKARKVSRYSFMNFRPSFTCSSTSGS